jgi:hypothetical protein
VSPPGVCATATVQSDNVASDRGLFRSCSQAHPNSFSPNQTRAASVTEQSQVLGVAHLDGDASRSNTCVHPM